MSGGLEGRLIREDGQHLYVMPPLDAEECENIAHALGLRDLGAQDLLRAAGRIRELDVEL